MNVTTVAAAAATTSSSTTTIFNTEQKQIARQAHEPWIGLRIVYPIENGLTHVCNQYNSISSKHIDSSYVPYYFFYPSMCSCKCMASLSQGFFNCALSSSCFLVFCSILLTLFLFLSLSLPLSLLCVSHVSSAV